MMKKDLDIKSILRNNKTISLSLAILMVMFVIMAIASMSGESNKVKVETRYLSGWYEIDINHRESFNAEFEVLSNESVVGFRIYLNMVNILHEEPYEPYEDGDKIKLEVKSKDIPQDIEDMTMRISFQMTSGFDEEFLNLLHRRLPLSWVATLMVLTILFNGIFYFFSMKEQYKMLPFINKQHYTIERYVKEELYGKRLWFTVFNIVFGIAPAILIYIFRVWTLMISFGTLVTPIPYWTLSIVPLIYFMILFFIRRKRYERNATYG